MPLSLLQYQVFRQSAPLLTQNEIDGPQVPVGQVYRVSHLAVACYFPVGNDTFWSPAAPMVGVWDAAQPKPTSVPCQVTTLSPLFQNGLIGGSTLAGAPFAAWYDVNDDVGITLNPGDQLAVVFFPFWTALASPAPPATCAVRAEFEVFQGTAGEPQPAAGLTPGPSIPAAM